MYNRYIPQRDGTYRRQRMNDPTSQKPQSPPAGASCPPPPPEPVCPPQEPSQGCPPPPIHEHRPPSPPKGHENGNLLSFFKNLLPGELDTADLLIILLLLLMANDHCDDKNTALLTLALYFFL